MKFLYLLDSYTRGGAQLGLATLVENGFFEDHEVTICALSGVSLVERLEASVGPQHVISLLGRGPLNTGKVLISIVPLLKLLWRERPNVMIVSLPRANVVGRVASLFFPSVKVVSFEHNTDYRNKFSPVLKYTSPLVAGVFFDHQETWASVQKPFYPDLAPERSCYVPLVMFSEVPETVSDKAFPRKEPAFRIISAGRLTAQKNYVELLYAIRKLLDDGYNVELLIAGTGELETTLRETAVLLGLQDRVSLPGFLKDWASLCSEFDIYVQTSLYEGLCISVLEAMAQAMLVVASDVGGIRQYGRDRGNMIKIQGETRAEIAKSLAAAMTLDRSAVLQLRHNALRTVQDEFGPSTVKRHWRTAMGFLLELSNRSGNASAA